MDSSSKSTFQLVFLFAFVMLVTAGFWGVVETSEARYAEISREMYHSKNWIEPTLLGIRHFHKPPVTYWLTSLSFGVWGVNPFATRFFLIISYVLQVYLIYKIALALFEKAAIAKFAAIIYATLPIVLIAVRTLTTDAFLQTFVLLILYGWIQFLKTRRNAYLWLVAISAGFGFLTKGHAAVLVPALAAFGLLWVLPRPPLFKFQYLLALAVFILLAFSWYALVTRENQDLGYYFIIRHFYDRFFHADVFSRTKPFYYYILIFPAVSLPWFIFFIRQFFVSDQSNPAHKLAKNILIWWIVLPFIVYSASNSKLTLYILPLFAGFSLVTAYYFEQPLKQYWRWIVFTFQGIILLALLVCKFALPEWNLPWWLMLIPAIALLISIMCCLRIKTEQRAIVLLVSISTTTILIYSALLMHFNSLKVNAITPIADYIKARSFTQRPVLVYNKFLPSLAFELDKEIISIYDNENALKRETQFEKTSAWKKQLINIHESSELLYLKSLLQRKSVIVAKSELPKEIRELMDTTWQKEAFDKWTVYFN
ncbi:hypothetical protein C3K47_10465 [Solitalea longa]|uniref:Glycosyltransferase RgtA/B/C/D-like domain-containing protein n=1 Tax=Solitalea longa TaxID=2079460 RepID=A0A2S5A2G7_9SPHI|nr:glycosyltransferase family 39 protein [Solitalea longa]POY36771.1 hypothetical protein C3K47_10465 [Solitalea longa]